MAGNRKTERRLSLSEKMTRLRGRLRDPQWRKYGRRNQSWAANC